MIRQFSWMAGMVVAALGMAGCSSDGSGDADTYAEGETQYQDASTDESGATQEPAAPPPQDDMTVEIHLAGTGTLGGLAPSCELEGATGQFAGLLEGQGEIDDNGLYVAAFAQSDGAFTTPSGGCQIPDLSIGSLTEVTIRALLENTSENCNTYCEAKARSEAEAECGSSAGSASCRSEVEAEYAGSCETACTGSTTRRIVAEAQLSASAVAALNASSLGVNGLGTLEADLTFDHIEEENGSTVSED